MTPKEKAEHLIIKNLIVSSKNNYNMSYTIAKQCALIAVDEIIKELTEEISPSVHGFRHKYWEEVKQEINKL